MSSFYDPLLFNPNGRQYSPHPPGTMLYPVCYSVINQANDWNLGANQQSPAEFVGKNAEFVGNNPNGRQYSPQPPGTMLYPVCYSVVNQANDWNLGANQQSPAEFVGKNAEFVGNNPNGRHYSPQPPGTMLYPVCYSVVNQANDWNLGANQQSQAEFVGKNAEFVGNNPNGRQYSPQPPGTMLYPVCYSVVNQANDWNLGANQQSPAEFVGKNGLAISSGMHNKHHSDSSSEEYTADKFNTLPHEPVDNYEDSSSYPLEHPLNVVAEDPGVPNGNFNNDSNNCSLYNVPSYSCDYQYSPADIMFQAVPNPSNPSDPQYYNSTVSTSSSCPPSAAGNNNKFSDRLPALQSSSINNFSVNDEVGTRQVNNPAYNYGLGNSSGIYSPRQQSYSMTEYSTQSTTDTTHDIPHQSNQDNANITLGIDSFLPPSAAGNNNQISPQLPALQSGFNNCSLSDEVGTRQVKRADLANSNGLGNSSDINSPRQQSHSITDSSAQNPTESALDIPHQIGSNHDNAKIVSGPNGDSADSSPSGCQSNVSETSPSKTESTHKKQTAIRKFRRKKETVLGEITRIMETLSNVLAEIRGCQTLECSLQQTIASSNWYLSVQEANFVNHLPAQLEQDEIAISEMHTKLLYINNELNTHRLTVKKTKKEEN